MEQFNDSYSDLADLAKKSVIKNQVRKTRKQDNDKKNGYNKKYIIIAVSVLIAEFTARNGGAVDRKATRNRQLHAISERWAQQ